MMLSWLRSKRSATCCACVKNLSFIVFFLKRKSRPDANCTSLIIMIQSFTVLYKPFLQHHCHIVTVVTFADVFEGRVCREHDIDRTTHQSDNLFLPQQLCIGMTLIMELSEDGAVRVHTTISCKQV